MKPGQRTASYGSPAPPAPADAATPRVRHKARVEPFSAWQKLVEERRIERELSTRALAAALLPAAPGLKHTTLWSWLRHPDGVPPKNSYSAEMNRLLARALDLKPDRLAEAFEESRRHLILSDTSKPQQGTLNLLRTLFAGSKRKTWKTEEIVKLIDQALGH